MSVEIHRGASKSLKIGNCLGKEWETLFRIPQHYYKDDTCNCKLCTAGQQRVATVTNWAFFFISPYSIEHLDTTYLTLFTSVLNILPKSCINSLILIFFNKVITFILCVINTIIIILRIISIII